MISEILFISILGAGVTLPGAVVADNTSTASPFEGCSDGYADSLGALSAQARAYDRQPEATFSYCTRNSAVYECLSYGSDGAVRRQRRKAVLHGTAFAYKHQDGETLLLTNEHVGAWPTVTDPMRAVDGIPPGCKKIAETLTIVDDEHDGYARDDVVVTRVASDPELDVAVLKTREHLHVMPWKIGRSATIRERNAVEVRGFPLGAFRATSLGKVISAHDHDDYGEWDHDDFVIDALLSSGNSGSPVLAVSCATGEYELVGVFHAGYTKGSALNVVVGIDQVRDLMTTLKGKDRNQKANSPPGDRNTRASVMAALEREQQIFFPFGGSVAEVKSRPDGALLYVLFPKAFPSESDPMIVIEDRSGTDAANWGEMDRVWFGSARGLKGYPPLVLGSEVRDQVTHLRDGLRADASAHVAYRQQQRDGSSSRQKSERASRTVRSLAKTAASRAELVQGLAESVERLGPESREGATRFAELLLTQPKLTVNGTHEENRDRPASAPE